jgi:hypothetical protein
VKFLSSKETTNPHQRTCIMKKLASMAAVLGLGLSLAASLCTAAPIATVDQENLSGPNVGSLSQPVGQSFIPSLTAVDAVDVELAAVSNPIDVQVNILDGISGSYGLSGTVLGSSGTVTLSSTTLSLVHFDLSSEVALTPGNTYVIEVVPVNNTNGYSFRWAESGSNPYRYGQDLQTGIAPGSVSVTSVDMVFVEGLSSGAVPTEPSTWGKLKALY